jgi:hypothetical protein
MIYKIHSYIYILAKFTNELDYMNNNKDAYNYIINNININIYQIKDYLYSKIKENIIYELLYNLLSENNIITNNKNYIIKLFKDYYNLANEERNIIFNYIKVSGIEEIDKYQYNLYYINLLIANCFKYNALNEFNLTYKYLFKLLIDFNNKYNLDINTNLLFQIIIYSSLVYINNMELFPEHLYKLLKSYFSKLMQYQL